MIDGALGSRHSGLPRSQACLKHGGFTSALSHMEVHHMSAIAKHMLKKKACALAFEAMRDAQMFWRGRSDFPLPAFSIEEQCQIETIYPSMKLPARGVLSNQCNIDCVICWDTLPDPTSYILGPCSHAFHEACVALWLTDHATCPLCRQVWLLGSRMGT